MSEVRVNRRAWLAGAGAAAGLGLVSSMVACGPDSDVREIAALLRAAVPGLANSRAIADEYLRQAAEEHDPIVLLQRLDLVHAAMGMEEVRTHLRRRSQSDFAAGEVVHIRGWLLSRTEARVAALTSLA